MGVEKDKIWQRKEIIGVKSEERWRVMENGGGIEVRWKGRK